MGYHQIEQASWGTGVLFRYNHQTAAGCQSAPDFKYRKIKGERMEHRPYAGRTQIPMPQLCGDQPDHIAVGSHYAFGFASAAGGINNMSDAIGTVCRRV